MLPLEELKAFAWVALKVPLQWNSVETLMSRLNEQKLYNAQENAVNLHTQFSFVKNYCTEAKITQWRCEKVAIVSRWVEIFGHLNVQGCEYKEMATLIEYVLCLPGTTASVERLFSAMNRTWTEEKTRLKIETLKAILTIKCNLRLSCTDFYKYLKTQPTLLRQIAAKDKYKISIENDEVIEFDDDSDGSSVNEN